MHECTLCLIFIQTANKNNDTITLHPLQTTMILTCIRNFIVADIVENVITSKVITLLNTVKLQLLKCSRSFLALDNVTGWYHFYKPNNCLWKRGLIYNKCILTKTNSRVLLFQGRRNGKMDFSYKSRKATSDMLYS